MSTLTQTVRQELTRYFNHLAERVERAMRALPPEKLWAKPFPFGNSMGHLLLHLAGNLNHYIGAGIAGTGYTRDRPLEFSDTKQYSGPELLQRFKDAVAMVVQTIESMDDASFLTPISYHDQHPIETRFGLLLVCASHLNNHIGQMSYLLQAQGHSTNEPPVW